MMTLSLRLLYSIVLLFTFSFSTCRNVPGTRLEGKVISISDGDSFTILDGQNNKQRIRLYGIDSPENGQAFGRAAKQALSELIHGRDIVIEWKDRDSFGRIVGIAYVDGLNINTALLKAGWAWHFDRYDNNAKWERMEEESRKRKRGLWADPHPVAPWEFRRR